jgi:hypothetical protein
MKGNRAVLTAIVIVIVVVAGWWLFRRGGGKHVDLLTEFQTAQKLPAGATFSVIDATLNGETKKAIAAPPESRVIWHVRVPDDGWLKVSLGVQPDAWTKEGNGTLFRVGVSDGRAYEELFTEHVNPFAKPSERRWIPVMVDLSVYAGEEMQIVFNTNAGPPNVPRDVRNDLPLWGAPEIVTR